MLHPSQTSDEYSNKGRMYVKYNLFSISLDNLYLSFLKNPIDIVLFIVFHCASR